jgi:hypothetical protein
MAGQGAPPCSVPIVCPSGASGFGRQSVLRAHPWSCGQISRHYVAVARLGPWISGWARRSGCSAGGRAGARWIWPWPRGVRRRRLAGSSVATSGRHRLTTSDRCRRARRARRPGPSLAGWRAPSASQRPSLGDVRGGGEALRPVARLGPHSRGVVLDLWRARHRRHPDVARGRRGARDCRIEDCDRGRPGAHWHHGSEATARIAAERGWQPRSVSAVVLVEDGRTNRRRLIKHRAVLRAAFLSDGRRLAGWLRDPRRAVAILAIWPNVHPGDLGPRSGGSQRIRIGSPRSRQATAGPRSALVEATDRRNST